MRISLAENDNFLNSSKFFSTTSAGNNSFVDWGDFPTGTDAEHTSKQFQTSRTDTTIY